MTSSRRFREEIVCTHKVRIVDTQTTLTIATLDDEHVDRLLRRTAEQMMAQAQIIVNALELADDAVGFP